MRTYMNKKALVAVCLTVVVAAATLTFGQAQKTTPPAPAAPGADRIDKILQQNEEILRQEGEILKQLDEVKTQLSALRRRSS